MRHRTALPCLPLPFPPLSPAAAPLSLLPLNPRSKGKHPFAWQPCHHSCPSLGPKPPLEHKYSAPLPSRLRIWKEVHVRRIYDPDNHCLIYVAYTSRLTQVWERGGGGGSDSAGWGAQAPTAVWQQRQQQQQQAVSRRSSTGSQQQQGKGRQTPLERVPGGWAGMPCLLTCPPVPAAGRRTCRSRTPASAPASAPSRSGGRRTSISARPGHEQISNYCMRPDRAADSREPKGPGQSRQGAG